MLLIVPFHPHPHLPKHTHTSTMKTLQLPRKEGEFLGNLQFAEDISRIITGLREVMNFITV